MRDLLVSAALLVLLIGGWLLFDSYSDAEAGAMTDAIRGDLIPAVEAQNWPEACERADSLAARWENYRGKALFFLNSEELLEIDQCLAKACKYINAEDVSNSSGELNALASQLDFLTAREKITWENVF